MYTPEKPERRRSYENDHFGVGQTLKQTHSWTPDEYAYVMYLFSSSSRLVESFEVLCCYGFVKRYTVKI